MSNLSLKNLDVQTLWTQLQKPYLFWLINSILAIVFVAQLYHGIVALRTQQPSTIAQPLDVRPVVTTPPKADIPGMHLFGLTTLEQAPETRLNLQLTSIYLSNIASDSRVVINTGREQKNYKVGDVLIGGALLESILQDRVILRYNGQLESLLLQREYLELNKRINV